MTTVRRARRDDAPRLVEMGVRFIASTRYRDVLEANPERLRDLCLNLMVADGGYMAVAECDGAVVGMIGLLKFAHMMTGELCATELFWWVEPEARGRAGLRLLKAAEEWARANGVKRLHMIAPDATVGQLYEHLGFQELERSYERRF